MINNNKKTLDLPFFELLNQIPSTTTSVSTITTSEDGSDRYIYGIVGSLFYRYDTQADTWQALATPNVASSNIVSMRFTKKRGFHGRVLAAGANTVTIPGIRGAMLNGETISITQGPGAGQSRTLTYTGETVHDSGTITGTTTSTLVDGLKKWRVNQWAGYTVAITFGTDATHHKKIIYNDATTLYVADPNLQPHDPWNNQTYLTSAPYVQPVVTAGSQAHYQIMSSQFTVSPAWTSTPTNVSYFTTLSGGIYLLTSSASAPFISLQYYDILNDIWQTKTIQQGFISAALGTDACIERLAKVGTLHVKNSASGTISSTNRTITDTGLALVNDRYTNYRVYIVSGTGIGQSRRIVAHTATTFTVARSWDVNPASDSQYEVWPDSDRIYIAGNNAASLFAYSPENDYAMHGQAFDDGIVTNISATLNGWLPIGISTGVRIAAGVLAVNPVPTAGGTGYSIGDVLTCSVGGTGAQVRVTSIAPGGVVTGIELVHVGTATGFTTGTAKAITGGTGTLCTIEITSVGPAVLVTTNSAHFFRAGDSVVIAGCNEAAYNVSTPIIGVPSTTTFCVATTATVSMAATLSQSATTLVDPTKNWIVNEHVGRLVHLSTAGTGPTAQVRWIISNTANTLTVASWTAGGPGTSKYVIYDAKIFGVDDQRKEDTMKAYGWAVSGSTTTLVDSTKTWVPNQWAGYYFKIEAGTGYGSGRIAIISNTDTTLTFATQSFTPDATTKYEIADSWGLSTAVGATTTLTETGFKNWASNQWAGKRIKITGGTSTSQESLISANTNNTLTFGAIGAAPDTTSVYAILGIGNRSTGTSLVWVWGATEESKRGRYMYSPRGGGTNSWDIYDITLGKWTYNIQLSPQSEGYTTGSSYSYDGGDIIYASRSGTNLPIRIFELDTRRNIVVGSRTSTFLQGTATIGNMMETVTSPDGYEFLYILQNTGTLFARSLIF